MAKDNCKVAPQECEGVCAAEETSARDVYCRRRRRAETIKSIESLIIFRICVGLSRRDDGVCAFVKWTGKSLLVGYNGLLILSRLIRTPTEFVTLLPRHAGDNMWDLNVSLIYIFRAMAPHQTQLSLSGKNFKYLFVIFFFFFYYRLVCYTILS